MGSYRLCGFFGAVAATIALGRWSVAATPSVEAPGGVGAIAAKYPNDAGIGKDPRVVFADDFEGWEVGKAKPPPGTWGAVRGGDPEQRQTLVTDGKVAVVGKEMPGKKV